MKTNVISLLPTRTATESVEPAVSLSDLVLAVLQEMPARDLIPVAAPGAGIAFQPRSLLALLTFCYAKGIYASQEIEDVMRRDAAFRRCCANEFPDWRTLRRFRSKNRHMIQNCLATTLREAKAAADMHNRRGDSPLVTKGPRWDDESFAQEAAGRIENAMQMDLMADEEW